MSRIVGLEIFDDEVLTTAESADDEDLKNAEPADVEEVTEESSDTEPADFSEDEPKKSGKK